MFRCLGDEAHKRHLAPLIVTFRDHPRQVLQMGYQPQLLSSLDERRQLLEQYAPIEFFDFQQIRTLTAGQFMRLLKERHEVDALLVGYDHRFGSDRIQDVSQLKFIGQSTGIEIVQASQFELPDNPTLHISSTEIRNAISGGDLTLANQLLGHPYTLTGSVVHGRGIGRTLGFPTANIAIDEPRKLLPPPGVYAVRADWKAAHEQPAILNIGTNPTIGENPITIELHIPGLDLDLYGRKITVHIIRFLRPEQRFESLQALQAQIEEDVKRL